MIALTAAITLPNPCGLICSRVRPIAPMKSQRQRPLARNIHINSRISLQPVKAAASGGVPLPPLDLTEKNIELVLADARLELAQLFDDSVGITGNPRGLEVEIEDEKQLDDSPASF